MPEPKKLKAEMNGFSEMIVQLEKAEPVEAIVVNNETMHILEMVTVLEKKKDGSGRARLRLVITERCAS